MYVSWKRKDFVEKLTPPFDWWLIAQLWVCQMSFSLSGTWLSKMMHTSALKCPSVREMRGGKEATKKVGVQVFWEPFDKQMMCRSLDRIELVFLSVHTDDLEACLLLLAGYLWSTACFLWTSRKAENYLACSTIYYFVIIMIKLFLL